MRPNTLNLDDSEFLLIALLYQLMHENLNVGKKIRCKINMESLKCTKTKVQTPEMYNSNLKIVICIKDNV